MHTAVITVGLDPEIHLGPATVTWHGVTIALGILLGAAVAIRWARGRSAASLAPGCSTCSSTAAR
jgi:prolipoprotein diacylglyceryltransferase